MSTQLAAGEIREDFGDFPPAEAETNIDPDTYQPVCDPGFYPALTRRQYFAIPAVSQSLLHEFERTPAHVQCRMLRPKPETESQRLGTLIHAALLEPGQFATRYVVLPDLTQGVLTSDGKPTKNPKATTEYKARLAKFGQEHAGKTFVTAEQWETCTAITESIATSATASDLLSTPGETELAIVWRDPETDCLCKALIDRLTEYDGDAVVVDVKTTDDARPVFWAKHCHTYGCHLQAVWYLWGLKCLGRPAYRFLHVAVETSDPFAVAVRELDDESMRLASITLRQYLNAWLHCSRTGRWPGYPDAVEPVRLPRYAFVTD